MSNPESIAREYLETANKRDFGRMRELFHADYTYTGGDGKTEAGAQAGLDVAQMYTAAFPDAKLDVKRVHVAGDTVTVEFEARGTHGGELMGIAPTNRTVHTYMCTVLDIRDGKIYAEREYMDMAAMLQQLGVMPEMATA